MLAKLGLTCVACLGEIKVKLALYLVFSKSIWVILTLARTALLLPLAVKEWRMLLLGDQITFYGPDGLPTRYHFFKFPRDTSWRNRWCNLIKRQHRKDAFL